MEETHIPRNVVITAAGAGTRLLPMTKELPKEMLPIYAKENDNVMIKPLLQALFEQFYACGARDFCVIVGRGKRAIEDHFTVDQAYMDRMEDKLKPHIFSNLESFYGKVTESRMVWINQHAPKGFGHAVLLSEEIEDDMPFFVAAADNLILSKGASFQERMAKAMATSNAEVAILVREVEDPRAYGVVSGEDKGTYLEIEEMEEKPKEPKSNFAAMGFYIFNKSIFDALKRVKPGYGGEIQLTDAIVLLIKEGKKVIGVKMDNDEIMLDVGTPENYARAIKKSYENCSGNRL